MVELVGVTGFKELERKLKELPTVLQNQFLQKAVYEAAKVVRDEARNKVPLAKVPYWVKLYPKKGAKSQKIGFVARGWLKKQIILSKVTAAMASKQGSPLNFGDIRYYIGFSRLAWWGRLIETGWMPTGPKGGFKGTSKAFRAAGKEKRKAKGLGHVPGRPFLRPAFDNNVQKTIETLRTKLAHFLKVELK